MHATSRARLGWIGAVAVGAVVLCLWGVGAARAADSIYWGNIGASTFEQGVSFANLDGSGGGNFDLASAAVDDVSGIALDPLNGRIYWANRVADKFIFANLDFSGGGTLDTGSVPVNNPIGIAIDPVAGRIYWSDFSANPSIFFARLDGSGGGTLNTAGATVGNAFGLAISRATGRIYWANGLSNGNQSISFASLDGSGGGNLSTAGAFPLNEPTGVAVDEAAGRIYWANRGAGTISFANLDGSGGGGDLNTNGATVALPSGVALDPIEGRIYWANFVPNGKISFANLDGTGGGDIPTGNAIVSKPTLPALLHSPRLESPPTVTGGSAALSTLSCSQGTWLADLRASLLYQEPRSFSFQWSRNGVDLPGATRSSFKTSAGGEHRCRVTAINHAGATAATSEPHRVDAPPEGNRRVKLTLTLVTKRIRGKAPLAIRISNGGAIAARGSLSGSSTSRRRSSKQVVELRAKRFEVGAGASTVVRLRLPEPLRARLALRGKLAIALRANFAAPGSQMQVARRVVVVKPPVQKLR